MMIDGGTVCSVYVDWLQMLNGEVMPKHMSLQELNYAADELMKSSSADQAALIREPLASVNRRWESLHQNIAKKMVCLCETDLCLVCLLNCS